MKKIFVSVLCLLVIAFTSGCDLLDDYSSSSNTSFETNQLYEDVSLDEITFYDSYTFDKPTSPLDLPFNDGTLSIEEKRIEVIEYAQSTIVAIQTLNGSGSGVIYNKSDNYYFILTNAHVTNGVNKVLVYFGDNNYIDGYVMGYDDEKDLSVVRIESKETLTWIPLENVDVKKGSTVYAIGSPLGLEYYNSVSIGIVSNISPAKIQHTASINPGNSGGALINSSGQLIGINSSKIAEVPTSDGNIAVEGMGFAINYATINNCISKLEVNHGLGLETILIGINGLSIQTYLLIAETDNYPQLKKEYIPENMYDGLIVTAVEAFSPAHLANIQAFDIIYSVDGVIISNISILEEMLLINQNKTFNVQILRLVNNNFVLYNTIVSLK